MGYIYLLFAILFEVLASSMLKVVATFNKNWAIIFIVVGYMISFYFLSMALVNIPLSIGYATWGGLGTALTAVVGYYFFKETMNKRIIFGIVLLVFGIVLMQL